MSTSTFRVTAACAVLQATCVTVVAAVVHHRTGLVWSNLAVGYGNAALLAFAAIRMRAVRSGTGA